MVPRSDQLEMVRRYSEGQSLRAIAREMNYGPTTVRKHILAIGIKLRPHGGGSGGGKKRLSYDELRATHELRSQGLLLKEIAQILGISLTSVHDRLKSIGVK